MGGAVPWFPHQIAIIQKEKCIQYVDPVERKRSRILPSCGQGGPQLGQTPTCEDLFTLQPSCGVVCGAATDYSDNSLLCAGGELRLRESATGICSVAFPEETSDRTGTLLICTGTPQQITDEIKLMTFIPPPLYNSGRPERTNVFLRATFAGENVVGPDVYRKDIKISVLPINTAPEIVGSREFRVQEDRPTILSPKTPGRPGLASVAIFDDAEFQVRAALTK